jgi:hypothetical protein
MKTRLEGRAYFANAQGLRKLILATFLIFGDDRGRSLAVTDRRTGSSNPLEPH